MPSGLRAAAPASVRTPWWPAALGLTVLLGALGSSLWHHQQLASIVPTDSSLEAAAKVIGGNIEPSDAVAVYPGWAAAQTWRLQDLWKQRGLQIDDHFLQSEQPDLWDADGHKRLWLLTTHNYASRLDTLAWPGKELARHDVGQGTAAVLLEIPASKALLDLRRQAGQGKLELEQPGGGWSACRWDGKRFRCGSDEWKDVRGGWNEVGGSRHPCLFVQSPGNKLASRLTWTVPAPPAGVRLATFAGRIGNRLWAVRNGNLGSTAVLTARVGQREVARVELPPADFALHTFEAPLTAADAGQPLVLEVRADDHAWRQVCLEGRVLADQPVPMPATAGGLGIFAASSATAVAAPEAATPTGAADAAAQPDALVGPQPPAAGKPAVASLKAGLVKPPALRVDRPATKPAPQPVAPALPKVDRAPAAPQPAKP